MTSPQPSSASLSIEEMEAVMQQIEQGTTTVDAVAVLSPTPEQAKAIEQAFVERKPGPITVVTANTEPTITPVTPKSKSPIEAFVTADELAGDVAIDPDDIDGACITHAARFVHYANLRAKARGQFEKMKAAFEILESRLYAEYREKLAAQTETVTDSKGKEVTRNVKPTEAMIDAAVKADKRWWAGKNRLIDAQMVYDLASNAASAFEQRRDMIVQMGSDRRQQRQGDLRIREQQQTRDSVLEMLRRKNAQESVSQN